MYSKVNYTLLVSIELFEIKRSTKLLNFVFEMYFNKLDNNILMIYNAIFCFLCLYTFLIIYEAI